MPESYQDRPVVETDWDASATTLSQIHPVLDHKNRPILAPTPFDINTSIQRSLVKAIALHGLGLNIYAGEDSPDLNGCGDTLADRLDSAKEALLGLASHPSETGFGVAVTRY